MNVGQQKGKIKKQPRIQNSRRAMLIILITVITITATIISFIFTMRVALINNFCIFLPSFITVVGGTIAFVKFVFFPSTPPTEPQNTTIAPLASVTTPPATEQSSQQTPAPVSTTQPLENEAGSVEQPSQETPTDESSTRPLEKDIFQFNGNLKKASDFYGRKKAINTLLRRTENKASTSIVGPGRIGKSWLVEYLKIVAKREISSNVCLGLINAQSATCRSIEDFTKQAVEKLNGSLDPQPVYADLAFLEKTVEKLMRNDRRPVLCIDKFEGFSNRKAFDLDFFTQLRAIAQRGLVLVTVSKAPLIDIIGDYGRTSGLFNIIEQITLKPFTREEAEEFVISKSKHAGFTPEEQEALLRYGQVGQEQWPPNRLQLVGGELLSDKVHNPSSYQPDDQAYWKDFKQRIEEKYRRIGRPK